MSYGLVQELSEARIITLPSKFNYLLQSAWQVKKGNFCSQAAFGFDLSPTLAWHQVILLLVYRRCATPPTHFIHFFVRLLRAVKLIFTG